MLAIFDRAFVQKEGDMKISVIVHSKTGTTRRFAEKIAEKLRSQGHETKLVQLEPDKPVNPDSKEFAITNAPDCSGFDVVLAGGPVWAFAASPVIHRFLTNSPDINGKRVIPFVTAGLPFRFLGANRALKQMTADATQAGARVEHGAAVLGFFHNRELEMEQGASAIANRLKEQP